MLIRDLERLEEGALACLEYGTVLWVLYLEILGVLLIRRLH